MMMLTLRAATIGILLAGAAPLFAQVTAPSAPAAVPAPAVPASPDMRAGPGGHAMHGELRGGSRGGMFAGMSGAGRTIMRDAMQAGGDRRTSHEAVKAARDRMLVVLDAERLDTAALKRAMDDERSAAQQGHDRRQTAMLAGFTKLSAADRRVFVANARAMRTRMEARIGKMHGGRDGGRGAMPPM